MPDAPYQPVVVMPDGRKFVRVTGALRAAGVIPTMHGATDYHADRGTAVHKTIELAIKGTLDESSVHPDVAPFLASWRKFNEATNAEWLETEVEVVSHDDGFCGRIDAIARINNVTTLIDFKSGGQAEWHRLQTALYWIGAFESKLDPIPSRRAVLYLHDDGSCATFVQHNSVLDLHRALTALNDGKKVLLA